MNPQDRPLVLCYGTRPQVVKASVLTSSFEHRWQTVTIDTGQHYDYELNELLYQQLGVRSPNILLGIPAGNPHEQVSAIIAKAGEAFARINPWAVVVIGDTNSTLGSGIAAAMRGIPIVHVEAGLRTTELNVPEEFNRRVVDAVSAVLCAPSNDACVRLAEERMRGDIVLTGDVARDVLSGNLGRAPVRFASTQLNGDRSYLFSTFHRAALTAAPEDLFAVLNSLGECGLPVIFAAHPRTRIVLELHGMLSALPATVHLHPPLGYLETIACIRDAAAVVTDSGGVQREAYWLGTPCITVREDTEWTELVDAGANVLVPPEAARSLIPDLVRRALDGWPNWNCDALGMGNAAAKITDAIVALERRLTANDP